MSHERMAKNLDAIVLRAISGFCKDKPASRFDLWSMLELRRACIAFGAWNSLGVLERSIQRLKKAGKIVYSRKPAGWVAT